MKKQEGSPSNTNPKNKVYRSKISKKKENKESFEQIISLKEFILETRQKCKDFPPTHSRSKILENLQCLLDFLIKKEKRFLKDLPEPSFSMNFEEIWELLKSE